MRFSTRSEPNGPSAPCSLHILERLEIALALRFSCAEVETRIAVPAATAPMLTGTAAPLQSWQRSRQDKVDGGRGHKAPKLRVVEPPAGRLSSARVQVPHKLQKQC